MTRILSATLLAAALLAGPALAQSPKTVGGAPMMPSDPIATNASKAGNLKTLVAAASAAGLVPTLAAPGNLTVFAPTDSAFAALPAGTVETLLKPENKRKLTKVLKSHVVPGKYDAQALVNLVAKGGGKARLKTASGDTLVITQPSKRALSITDESGRTATTRITDVYQSNGVVHVINIVLLPK